MFCQLQKTCVYQEVGVNAGCSKGDILGITQITFIIIHYALLVYQGGFGFTHLEVFTDFAGLKYWLNRVVDFVAQFRLLLFFFTASAEFRSLNGKINR